MKQRKLGCLTGGGLLALGISLIAIGASYAFSQNLMFSPGNLNSQPGDLNLGGVSSHAEVETECSLCHSSPWDPTHMSDLCQDCHQNIPSQLTDTTTLHGAAITKMESEDCRACHTDHNGATAPLTEYILGDFPHELVLFDLNSHKNIDWTRDIVCADCHPAGFLDFELSVCYDCHQDIDQVFVVAHSSLFETNCLACHDGFESYGADFDHNLQPFPLFGQHQNLSCDACHPGAVSIGNLKTTPAECVDCHRKEDAHLNSLGIQCGDCHNPAAWKPALYDHELTGFSLIEGHDSLLCENCHTDTTYQGQDPVCISCHFEIEPHNNQYGTECSFCHTNRDWSEIIFEHSVSYTQDCGSCHLPDSPTYHYPGECSLCHVTDDWLPASFDHKSPAAGDCQSCHFSDRPANHYLGQCSLCHYIDVWKPANFNHSFPLTHGGAQKRCQLCHTSSNYYAYTCYTCHEHNKNEIKQEHEDISNLTNCIRCHPGGRKEDDD